MLNKTVADAQTAVKDIPNDAVLMLGDLDCVAYPKIV